MIARVESFVLRGIDAIPCEIELDLSSRGLPGTTLVGLPDTAVRESIDRVRTAIANSGYRFPTARMTVNLAPADVRKEGPVYDLAIALGILLANGTVAAATSAASGAMEPPIADEGIARAARDGEDDSASASPREPGTPAARHPAGGAPAVVPLELGDFLVAGELALDGRVRFVRGATSMALLARARGKAGVIVPRDNAQEAAAIDGIAVYGVKTLAGAVAHLNGIVTCVPEPTIDAASLIDRIVPAVDFVEVRGQEAAKRALAIAAAGMHNVLMLGPAGTGKTMMAKALPGILPPLTRQEALEITRIYSSVGQVQRDRPLVLRRPVRAPHHTASSAAIIGGGSIPRAGEVSLAHHGVLFLDELPEFSRPVLETLRQPLEDRVVTIARASGSCRFPADFMLVAALNPTQRGGMPDDAGGQRDMQTYLSRLSGPLIDRIDIHVEVPGVSYAQLTSDRPGTSSAELREQIGAARERQRRRQGDVPNGRLARRELDPIVAMDDAAHEILADAMRELELSARAYDKVRRVARTIADLEGQAQTTAHHIAEAVQYRLLDVLLAGR